MENKIKTIQEIEENWKECFIPSLPRMKRTKKNLIEGFELGCRVIKRGGIHNQNEKEN